jgi:hypothetical protein
MLPLQQTHRSGNTATADRRTRRCAILDLSMPEAREGPTAHTRFRTIQVCPKDLPSDPRQAERAVDRLQRR